MLGSGFLHISGKKRIFVQPLFEEAQNNFTYEFWVKPEVSQKMDIESLDQSIDPLGLCFVIGAECNSINKACLAISVGNNGVSVYECSEYYLTALLVYPISIKNWIHIAVVYTNKTPHLFINGKFIKSGLTSRKTRVYASGTFGGLYSSGFFTGSLDDLRIWAHARTEEQIRTNMRRELDGCEIGLICYWNFNHSNQISVRDGSPNSNHGLIVNQLVSLPEGWDEVAWSGNTPSFIYDNMDILERFFISQKPAQSNSNYTTPSLDKNHKNKQALVKSTTHHTDVLLLFGHYRKDYELFLYPVANRLVNNGISVTILIHKAAVEQTSKLDPRINIVVADNLFTYFNIYDKAKNFYQEVLLAFMEKWLSLQNLDPKEEKEIKDFYYTYAIDRIGTLALLNLIKPKLVYGIHFILNPGCLDAIKFMRQLIPIKIFLIQHGFFYECHDFKGADVAILWGSFHERILRELSAIPSVVIGNPKMEFITNSHTIGHKQNDSHKSKRVNILYISSPYANSKKNIKLFLKTMRNFPKLKVKYKLHPTESKKDYIPYIKKGLMKSKQIAKKKNIYKLISESDIIVGGFSTSLYEAALLKKPIIQILPPQGNNQVPLLNSFSSSKKLKYIIKNLCSNEAFYQAMINSQQKQLEPLFNSTHGSISKIANYIQDAL